MWAEVWVILACMHLVHRFVIYLCAFYGGLYIRLTGPPSPGRGRCALRGRSRAQPVGTPVPAIAVHHMLAAPRKNLDRTHQG
jgi:hypothetical protein